jgi:hypothetical protein
MRIIILLMSILYIWSCTRPAETWEIVENDQGLLLLEGADSVLFYQRAAKSLDGEYARANYIHPLYSLDNTVLTEDFPADHLHHRGVFWAWHQNYIGDQNVGDAWALEDFVWEVSDVRVTQSPDSCVIQTEVYWQSPLRLDEEGRQKPFVREKTSVNIHPRQENYRAIDFRIELAALEDSLFIGGSEDEKGYSGFSWRIPLPEGVAFTGAEGTVEPQTLAIEAGPWIDINGNLDGRNGREGVAVIDHPDNPGFPQPWILRRTRSMQNVAYPGRERVMIPRDRPLILKYRMVVYRGESVKTAAETALTSFRRQD